MNIQDYCLALPLELKGYETAPWQAVENLETIIKDKLTYLDNGYNVKDGVAVHTSARIDSSADIKAPAIIGPDCFVGPHTLLRGGVVLGTGVSIGPGCEIKRSVIGDKSAAAHFNFIGDSIVGSAVNLEAGAIVANHFNERADKAISITIGQERFDTGLEKFGAVIGDESKIGANAVTSPGTILAKNSIVKRLQLVEQN
jgi:NDP-sugar pyrophosphorylase family protein